MSKKSHTFYIVTYFIKWAKISRTDSTRLQLALSVTYLLAYRTDTEIKYASTADSTSIGRMTQWSKKTQKNKLNFALVKFIISEATREENKLCVTISTQQQTYIYVYTVKKSSVMSFKIATAVAFIRYWNKFILKWHEARSPAKARARDKGLLRSF